MVFADDGRLDPAKDIGDIVGTLTAPAIVGTLSPENLGYPPIEAGSFVYADGSIRQLEYEGKRFDDSTGLSRFDEQDHAAA
jgi:hypothetical protein